MSELRQRKGAGVKKLEEPKAETSEIKAKDGNAGRISQVPQTGSARPYPIYFPNFSIVFRLILISRLLSAVASPIADCDETFNYWEPTHYLQHGSGLQTWEYSPDYAIRSWAYVGIHAGLGWLLSFPAKSKRHVFMLMRILLGTVSAYAESSLCNSVAQHWNARVARYLLTILIFGTGMFISTSAYLPSTFAMYTTLLANASSLQPPSTIRTIETVSWYALGVILGWPFSGLSVVPFVLEELFVATYDGETLQSTVLNGVRRMAVAGGVVLLVILAPTVLIDSFFYRRPVFASLNLVLYNVFSGPGRGPDIFGTEPWWFYLVNLTLNWNIMFLLALAALPLVFLSSLLVRPTSAPNDSPPRLNFLTFLRLSALPMWLIVFSLQSHKEERFMYVAYPNVALSAAWSVWCVGDVVRWIRSTVVRGKLGFTSKLLIPTLLILFSVLSVFRSASLHLHYSAPLTVYADLHDHIATRISEIPSSSRYNATLTVCVGKEWHRFPSHYFLPHGARLAFLRSEFRGLLPKYFQDDLSSFHTESVTHSTTTWRPGTWLRPTGMNDVNREEPDRYVPLDTCDYIVDLRSHAAVSSSHSAFYDPTSLEPDYFSAEFFTSLTCADFLDTGATRGWVARAAWIPGWTAGKRWGSYCVMRRV
ncbi:mannosyltransferase [Gonapodya sp. JEL0774]|nr:mannosyltransferase [Gonapodya sp. JEL0774]